MTNQLKTTKILNDLATDGMKKRQAQKEAQEKATAEERQARFLRDQEFLAPALAEARQHLPPELIELLEIADPDKYDELFYSLTVEGYAPMRLYTDCRWRVPGVNDWDGGYYTFKSGDRFTNAEFPIALSWAKDRATFLEEYRKSLPPQRNHSDEDVSPVTLTLEERLLDLLGEWIDRRIEAAMES